MSSIFNSGGFSIAILFYREFDIEIKKIQEIRKSKSVEAIELVLEEKEDSHKDIEGEGLTHPKCIYTVLENGRWLNGGKNIDNEVGDSIRKIAKENG